MDDLDDYFGDDAANAFVDGLQLNNIHTEQDDESRKADFAQALMENDDIVLSSVLGERYEEESKKGKFAKLSANDIIEYLFTSELAGMLYPKDKETIEKFIAENKNQETYNEGDVVALTRMFVKLNF